MAQRSSQALYEIRGMSLVDNTPGFAAAASSGSQQSRFMTWSFVACWEGRRGQRGLCSKGVMQFLFMLYTAVEEVLLHCQASPVWAGTTAGVKLLLCHLRRTHISEKYCCSLYLFQSPVFLFIVMIATDADNLSNSIN